MVVNDVPTNGTHVFCPSCNGQCRFKKIGEKHQQWDRADGCGNSSYGGVIHSLLECNGCETIFYHTSSWHDGDLDHSVGSDGQTITEVQYVIDTFPKAESIIKPTWHHKMLAVDKQLHKVLDEVYAAHDSNAFILTAIGLRTALDRATEVLGIDPAITFAKKLDELENGRWIGSSERAILNVVTDAGSAAVHRAWSPDKQQVVELVSVTQIFLQRAFIIGMAALNISQSIPEKPKRQKTDKDRGV